MSGSTPQVIPPYGVAIQEAIKQGDLYEMKTLLQQRDATHPETHALQTAYEELTQEVARLDKI